MIRQFICILCPNGCEIKVKLEGAALIRIEDALCERGNQYVEQELFAPQRNIATSVRVEGGNMPLVSVRLTDTIPKEKIIEVMAEIKKVKVKAPVLIGQVLIKNVLGLEQDVIATKHVSRIE